MNLTELVSLNQLAYCGKRVMFSIAEKSQGKVNMYGHWRNKLWLITIAEGAAR